MLEFSGYLSDQLLFIDESPAFSFYNSKQSEQPHIPVTGVELCLVCIGVVIWKTVNFRSPLIPMSRPGHGTTTSVEAGSVSFQFHGTLCKSRTSSLRENRRDD